MYENVWVFYFYYYFNKLIWETYKEMIGTYV